MSKTRNNPAFHEIKNKWIRFFDETDYFYKVTQNSMKGFSFSTRTKVTHAERFTNFEEWRGNWYLVSSFELEFYGLIDND